MGMRGPGAAKLRAARGEPEQAKRRRLPWKKAGLTRDQRVIAFLEFLPITKGILAGNRMKLLPGQCEFVQHVYGKLKPNGTKKTRIAIKSEPKGNGKTGMVAGLALCHLLGPECEV